MERHAFRRDFFHRINAFEIAVPPLRDRRDDISELAIHFAGRATQGTDVLFTNAALRMLIEHDWPGNVRELRNVIERALTVNSTGRVTARDLEFLTANQVVEPQSQTLAERGSETASERDWIALALKQNNYRKGATAKQLRMAPRTLYNKLKKFQLD